MVLIYGGVYQGKLDYAKERFKLAEEDIYRCREDPALPQGKKAIYELERWLKALLETGSDTTDGLKQLIAHNPEAIIIANDISCGIVPLDAKERQWREAAGFAMITLASAATEVIRLFCGIPTRLK